MQGGIKALAQGIDLSDTETLQRVLQESLSRSYPFDQGSIFNRFGLVTFGRVNGALQIVGNRKKLAGKICKVLLKVILGGWWRALAGILRIGKSTQQAVAQGGILGDERCGI